MKSKTLLSRTFLYTSFILCFVSLLGIIWLGNQYIQEKATAKAEALIYAQEQATLVSQGVNERMRSQVEVANLFSEKLTNGDIEYDEVDFLLEEFTKENDEFFGIIVAFESGVYSGADELYAPYYRKGDGGEFSLIQVENNYDYTDTEIPEATWYTETVEKGSPLWHGIFGKASQSFVFIYVEPFFRDSSRTEIAGAVGVVNSIDEFKDKTQFADLGANGYFTITNEEGTVVYHPKPEFLGATKEQVAGALNDPELLNDFLRIAQGEEFYRERLSAAGKEAWTFYTPLVAPKWAILTILYTDIIELPAKSEMRARIDIGIVLMLFITFLIGLVLRVDKGGARKLWFFSAIVALVFLSGIIGMWYLVIEYPVQAEHQKKLTNFGVVQEALLPVDEFSTERYLSPPTRIPTGILVKTLDVLAHRATVSGYIWQKYPQSVPASEIIAPHFLKSVGIQRIEERYRIEEDDSTLVGWSFFVTLEQGFEVTHYPLDEITVNISLDPGAFDQNTILVPDFAEYEFMVSSEQPGVSRLIDVPGWLPSESYFSYQTEDYNVGFGEANILQKDIKPALSFNIRAHREILSPLISYGVVIFLIAIQLFGLAVLRIETGSQVLSLAAALFFIVTVTHTNLRSSLAFNGTTYFEYFFIVLYVAIVAGAINGILMLSTQKKSLLSEQNSQFFKLAFWPTFFGAIWLITMIFFYT